MSEQKSGILLVVEDDADVREVILDALFMLPHKILTADNGKHALEMIAQNPITAVLSDINMPEMTGLELLESLRATGNDIPFVVLSGFSDRDNTLRALRAGAYDFLDKPFESEHLNQVISHLMKYGLKLEEINQRALDQKESGTPLTSEEILNAKKEIALMKFENAHFHRQKKRP